MASLYAFNEAADRYPECAERLTARFDHPEYERADARRWAERQIYTESIRLSAPDQDIAVRRELAGKMLAKVLADGEVKPGANSNYATISHAVYYGQTAIRERDFLWMAVLDSWHEQPPQGGEARPLTFDEHCEVHKALQAVHGTQIHDNRVISMDFYLDKEHHPQPSAGTFTNSSLYASVIVRPTRTTITMDERLTGGFPDLLAVPPTDERMAQLGEFVSGLHKILPVANGNKS